MKKTLIAMLIAVVSTSLFAADFLVYDYKASIKRLDLVLKYKKDKAIMQNYKVASDTIKGVVVIPNCANCLTSGGIESAFAMPENANEGWFVRVGDKLSENEGEKYVAHDPKLFVSVGKFGAYTLGKNPEPQDPKNNKYAWMKLGYALADNQVELPIDVFNKNFTSDEKINYRFLGASNSDAGYVVNTGFGTVKPSSNTERSYDPCEGTEKKTYSCDRIESITGTLCGGPTVDAIDELDPLYGGACETTPMWDLCLKKSEDENGETIWIDETVTQAVICGTWTLKYNAKLTKNYADSDYDVDVIYKHLGKNIDEGDVYDAR